MSCLSTRAATAIATSGVATALAADSSSSSGHGFARHYTMYKLPKIHTHTQTIEHAKYFHTCPYIRYVKGHAFIRDHHSEYRTEVD